jgi:hypothetical protein
MSNLEKLLDEAFAFDERLATEYGYKANHIRITPLAKEIIWSSS